MLWIDALYEKIWEELHVVSASSWLSAASAGLEDVISWLFSPWMRNNEEDYQALFQSLKDRGPKRVWLVVSDAHPGLRNAIQKEFLGNTWSRCKGHFMRNILAKVGGRNKDAVAGKIKHIWLQHEEKTPGNMRNRWKTGQREDRI